MRQINPDLLAHLASGATSLCHCWRVVLRDGLVLGFTDHDADLTVAATNYLARTGLDGTAAETSLGFAVGGSEIAGAFVAGVLSETDLANGRYDGAKVEVWLVNWADVSQRLLLDIGSIGQVKRSEFAFTAEVRTLAHEFDQERGRLYQAGCAADLGDARCGFVLTGAAYVTQAAVSATDARISLGAALGAYDNGWFTGGRIRFLSGGNTGAQVSIKQHSVTAGGALLTLWQPLAQPIAIGDRFEATAGCDKYFTTCQNKFVNQLNFRGFPQMPGNDHVLAYPAQGDPTLDGGSLMR